MVRAGFSPNYEAEPPKSHSRLTQQHYGFKSIAGDFPEAAIFLE
jgi:hypothetical protein